MDKLLNITTNLDRQIYLNVNNIEAIISDFNNEVCIEMVSGKIHKTKENINTLIDRYNNLIKK